MKYGICQWCLPVAGVDGVNAAAELGFDGMELSFVDELYRDVEAYRRRGEETGLAFPTLSMDVFCRRDCTVPEDQPFFVDCIRRAAETALRLSARVLQVPSFGASDIRTDDDLRYTADCLRAACEIARPLGLVIGTENALDLEKNERLFALVDDPALGFYFDTQNLLQMKGLRHDELLQAMAGRVCEVHVKDCLLGTPKLQYAALNAGETDFAQTIAQLKAMGYQDWVHLENDYLHPIHGMEGLSWQDMIRRDLQTVKRLMEEA